MLVPGAQPGFSQILLSIFMLAKKGSQIVVNNLKELGHGLSNTKTVFIQDKRAECPEGPKSIVPSNTKKGFIATHAFENIDWKNRLTTRLELTIRTHDLVENLSMSLVADCNFERKNHRLYNGSTPMLPNFYLNRGSAKRVKYSPVKNREEYIKSSLHSLV